MTDLKMYQPGVDDGQKPSGFESTVPEGILSRIRQACAYTRGAIFGPIILGGFVGSVLGMKHLKSEQSPVKLPGRTVGTSSHMLRDFSPAEPQITHQSQFFAPTYDIRGHLPAGKAGNGRSFSDEKQTGRGD